MRITFFFEIFHPGWGHTKDNTVVWLPQSRVLFAGCIVKSSNSHDLGHLAESNVTEWKNALNLLQAKYQNPRIIVPGHFNFEPGSSLIIFTKMLIDRHQNLMNQYKEE